MYATARHTFLRWSCSSNSACDLAGGICASFQMPSTGTYAYAL
jgi:hypothetical protein